MVRGDRVRDRLQQHRLAGARRRDDQSALSFADRREQVHNARADVLAHRLLLDALLRIQRRQVVEEDFVAGFVGRLKVNGLDLYQGEVFLAFMWRTNLAAYRVTGFEVELANLRRRNVDVIRTWQVVVVGRAKESVAVGQDFEDAFSEDVSFFFALCLQDLEDKVLLAETAGAREFQGTRNAG